MLLYLDVWNVCCCDIVNCYVVGICNLCIQVVVLVGEDNVVYLYVVCIDDCDVLCSYLQVVGVQIEIYYLLCDYCQLCYVGVFDIVWLFVIEVDVECVFILFCFLELIDEEVDQVIVVCNWF